MINLIIIDTNIYRQLGIKFFDNIDYKNLISYCYASGSEIRLSEVVFNEFMNYYQREHIEKPVTELEKSILRLNSFESFKELSVAISDEEIEKTKKHVEDILLRDNHLLRNQYVPVAAISDFLVQNKQETKKDNTRDFLIWLTAISESIRYPDDQVVIISQDKIYKENSYFVNLSKQSQTENKIKVFQSISEFLSIFGGKYDFLTKELIEEKVPFEKIECEIKKELNSFPSYVSHLFYHSRKKFKVEYFKINKIEVDNFYSYKDIYPEKNKFIVHFKVDLKIIYGRENPEIVQEHLNSVKQPTLSLETFDDEYRPIFEKPIMFIFEGVLNIKNESISRLKFIDFIIDYYFIDLKNRF